MNLGNNLFYARKMSGLSQEVVAEKLGVSQQTISKWESNETTPDIRQAKKMSVLYHMTLDHLIEFDVDLSENQDILSKPSHGAEEKIDWSKVWSKKYPILVEYQNRVNVPNYARSLNRMMDELKQECHYTEQDALLVLKDILYRVWKERKFK